MPPRIQIPTENIIDRAVEIVRTEGMERLNARSLADKLGCSVQPIFRAFDSMGDLKAAVLKHVIEYYKEYLASSISVEDGLVGLEMAYIRFAREEKHFFRLLHMSDRLGLTEMGEFTSTDPNIEIIEAMAKMTGLDMEKATQLYLGAFYAAHGIASMIATNHCEFRDEEIRGIMENVFEGIVMKLKREKEDVIS